MYTLVSLNTTNLNKNAVKIRKVNIKQDIYNSIDEYSVDIHKFPALIIRSGFGEYSTSLADIRLMEANNSFILIEITRKENIIHITNNYIYHNGEEFGIDADWMLDQNNITFIDRDLYKALYNIRYNYYNPVIFSPNGHTINDRLITFMMPFGIEELDNIYNNIKTELERIGYIVNRADSATSSTFIINKIFTLISTSRIVVCILYNNNRNVYYEMGLSHAIGRNSCLINLEDDMNIFDINHIDQIRGQISSPDDIVARAIKYIRDIAS